MSDKQKKQAAKLLADSLEHLKEIRLIMLGLQLDISEIKSTQSLILRESEINRRVQDNLAGDALKIKSRVNVLEKKDC